MQRRTILAVFVACVAFACATSPSEDPASPPTTTTNEAGTFAPDSGPMEGPPGDIFAHSETTLFRIDTRTRTMQEVGVFRGCAYVADIAIDADSTIYGATGTDLVVIEPNTAECTKIAQGAFPNSLSFVPAGFVGPGETLVGFRGGEYVKIDTVSGEVTKLGDIGEGFESSGDLVTTKEGRAFVTVRGNDCADCLAEVDPATGALVKNWGSIGRPNAFGLAFWAGEVFAFTNEGDLLVVDFDGDDLDISKIKLENAPAGLKFWGAGSTTSAPTGPVR